MTYEKIFETTKKTIMKSDVSNIEGHLAVQVDIVGEGEGAFYIELKDKQLFVEPYEYYDHDCKFIISADDFIKMVNGKLDPVLAYTTGKLKVEGNVDKALEFKKIVDSVKKQEKKAKSATKTEKKPAAKKPAAKKAEAKPAAEKKAPAKKTEVKPAEEKKAPAKKAEANPAEEKKAPAKKTEAKPAEEKKAPAKKAEAKPAEEKKAPAKKTTTKKTK